MRFSRDSKSHQKKSINFVTLYFFNQLCAFERKPTFVSILLRRRKGEVSLSIVCAFHQLFMELTKRQVPEVLA